MAGPQGAAQAWDLTADMPARRIVTDVLPARPDMLGYAAAVAALLLLLSTHRVGPGMVVDWRWGWQCLALFGTCLAMLRIVTRLAGLDAVALAIGALLIGVTWLDSAPALISGTTIIGGHITAGQAAIVVLALSVALAVDGSLLAAIALLGLVCAAQPHAAACGILALAGLSVARARGRAPIGRAWLIGGCCALAVEAGALWWKHAAGGGVPGAGALLSQAMPGQEWLVTAVPLPDWVMFGSMLVMGLAAMSVIGSEASAVLGAFLGVLVAFAVGCAVPLFTTSDRLLGLTPWGADTLLQLLATAAACAVVLRDLRGAATLRVVLSVAIAAALLLQPYLLPLAALAMLARAAAAHGELLGIERRIRDGNRAMLSRVAVGAVVLAAIGGCVLRGGL